MSYATTNYTATATIEAKPAPIAHIVCDDDASDFEWNDIIFEQWETSYWERPSLWNRAHANHGSDYKRFLFCTDSHGPQSNYYLSYSWNAPHAGVIHIPADYTNPREAAAAWLGEYTRWANGDVWGLELRDAWTGEVVESCWGFIGLDYAKDSARIEFGPVSDVVESF